jgi:O-antigen ligase
MHSRASATGGFLFASCGALLGVFVVLGGGTRQGLPVESLLQLIGLVALTFALLANRSRPLDGVSRMCLGWLAAVAVLLAGQLIPLPPGLWTSLAGRELLGQELALAGIEPVWRPISLVPEATLRALLALLPPAALLLLLCRLDLRQRVGLLKLVVILSVASIVLGFAQLAGGPASPLRWHDVTSATNAVGPFANRNHLATLLAISLPISAAWLIMALRRRRSDRRLASMVGAGFLMVLFILGLAVTRSRAGVLLGAAALACVVAMVWLHRERIQAGGSKPLRAKRWMLLILVAGVVISMQYGLVDLWGRLRTDPLEDKRWQIASTTFEAMGRFGFLGTGGGTFPMVYPSVESDAERNEYYVNRAHNDWLEWLLEGGVPLMLLVVAGVVLLLKLALAAVRSRARLAPWQMGAAAGLGLIALHSLLDYPLRTTALASIAVLLVSCLLPHGAAVPEAETVKDASPRPPPPPTPPSPVRQRTKKLETPLEPVPRPDLSDWELR